MDERRTDIKLNLETNHCVPSCLLVSLLLFVFACAANQLLTFWSLLTLETHNLVTGSLCCFVDNFTPVELSNFVAYLKTALEWLPTFGCLFLQEPTRPSERPGTQKGSLEIYIASPTLKGLIFIVLLNFNFPRSAFYMHRTWNIVQTWDVPLWLFSLLQHGPQIFTDCLIWLISKRFMNQQENL